MNKTELKDFVQLAQNEINNGSVEDKLRHILSAHLPSIFPENPWWVQEHVMGTETYMHFSSSTGKSRHGFADSVVGKTAIEYEKNLTIKAIFDEGYYQVREYCAALCNMGIDYNEILGILSDTVRWYGYKIEIVGNKDESRLYGAEDIKLIEEDSIDLSLNSDLEFTRFENFTQKYLNRSSSRILNAKALSLDFGTESIFYRKRIENFKSVVNTAMSEKNVYAELIKSVWQNFVAYLGASDYGAFSEETYVNEYYLVTVAKVICANIISENSLISSDDEIKEILNGKYFEQRNIMNLVDYDYFGWLNNSPYVELIIPTIRQVQEQLSCYDFKLVPVEDIFGELLAQLSKREHRLLLGQDFTPHWVASHMAEKVLGEISESPRMLDMCCGSGVFLIETIKAVRKKYGIDIDSYSQEKDDIVFSCTMGFDIDPLAVMLAKVNWVMSMKDLFPLHRGTIIIPVYHADSLFVATPVSHDLSDDNQGVLRLHFDGNRVDIPSYMVNAKHRNTFDSFMSKCYKLAMVRAMNKETELSDNQLDNLVSAIEMEANVRQSKEEEQAQRVSAYALVLQLERLQREGRNGIWHFILNNSYRPGLVEHQFNCIISNPPWLAMSKLADNPYKKTLLEKNDKLGIKPPGAAHLHMELASTFLLAAVDKYLKDEGKWLCVMPGSLMSGYNHEPLRREKYLSSYSQIGTSIDTIWELPITTFKNKAIVLGGKKTDDATVYPLIGRNYTEINQYEECEYTLNVQGKRSAWTNRGSDADVIDLINAEPWMFNQGADVFPRTALFHTYTKQGNGSWKIEKIEKTSELFYLISESKKNIGNDIEVNGFDDKYMYDCFISKHLSPFILSEPAKALIPGVKEKGIWKPIMADDIALMNPSTAKVFEEIESGTGISLYELLVDKINIYGKLYKQNFSSGRWLVLSNAGGSNPCAAYIDLEKYDLSKLIIDQTLYWYVASSEEEALFITGMINSTALNEAIKDFQPDGGFGKRHIHTLPYKVIPRYDSEDPAHLLVVEHTRILTESWIDYCQNNKEGIYILPNSGTLNSRRKKLQAVLRNLQQYESYESACNAVMGVEN
ncbi:MAG: N-6 DNA methylase [Lachnospiraceae bacterium]|nr:N-6 DNA methylase [Lachnospiraceae bacterium]